MPVGVALGGEDCHVIHRRGGDVLFQRTTVVVVAAVAVGFRDCPSEQDGVHLPLDDFQCGALTRRHDFDFNKGSTASFTVADHLLREVAVRPQTLDFQRPVHMVGRAARDEAHHHFFRLGLL